MYPSYLFFASGFRFLFSSSRPTIGEGNTGRLGALLRWRLAVGVALVALADRLAGRGLGFGQLGVLGLALGLDAEVLESWHVGSRAFGEHLLARLDDGQGLLIAGVALVLEPGEAWAELGAGEGDLGDVALPAEVAARELAQAGELAAVEGGAGVGGGGVSPGLR